MGGLRPPCLTSIMSIQLQLENTSVCNAKCVFCPYPATERPKGNMQMALHRRLVDESIDIIDITEICITGLGEPTLDPHLIERVSYARKNRNVIIGVYTNGFYMTLDMFKRLKKAGLGYLVFSLNATTAEQHARQMGVKDKFETVCRNINDAIRNRGEVTIKVRGVVEKDTWTAKDTAEFYLRWGHVDEGGHGQLILEGNWAGDNRTSRVLDPGKCCARALTQIYVTWDGWVTPCCFMPTPEVNFGDLKRGSIREAYNSPEYLAFREAHFKDKADDFEFCRRCSRI